MYGYIYKTTNKINGKIYIGQHKGKYDKNYYGSGLLIGKAILKYGIENFTNEVIEWCETLDDANEKEVYWIKTLNSFSKSGKGYNIDKGGGFGDITAGMTEERYNEWRSNIGNSNRGKKRSEEFKNRISSIQKEKFKNASFKENHSRNFSKRLKGNNYGSHNKGKVRSIETRKKISEAVSKTLKGNKRASKRVKVIYENIEYNFESRNDAVTYFKNKFNLPIGNYVGIGKDIHRMPKKYHNMFTFIGYE